MKTIQITIDPDLLEEMDNDGTCKEIGRSAFLRRAARHYLKRQRDRAITEKYRSGYAKGLAKGNDQAAWEEEQVWPPE